MNSINYFSKCHDKIFRSCRVFCNWALARAVRGWKIICFHWTTHIWCININKPWMGISIKLSRCSLPIKSCFILMWIHLKLKAINIKDSSKRLSWFLCARRGMEIRLRFHLLIFRDLKNFKPSSTSMNLINLFILSEI